jgi:hypothetical protein
LEKVALKVIVTGFGFAELTNRPDPDLSIVMGLGILNVHLYSMIWLNKHIFSIKYTYVWEYAALHHKFKFICENYERIYLNF